MALRQKKSAPVTIPATMAHRQFGELIRRVYSGQEYFIVEKDGLPVAAILSMAEYEVFIQHQAEQERQKSVEEFRQLAHQIGTEIEQRGLSEEEVMAELEETKKKVFRDYYGDIGNK